MFDRAEQAGEVLGEQPGEREAAHAHRIDGEEQEPAVGVEQAAAISDQRRQPVLEPPDLAFGATAELGRVEDDPVVTLAAAHLARGELGGVVDEPADRTIGCARERGVLARLGDRFLARVYVGHRAVFAEREGADAGVAEQVECLRVRLSGQLPAHPVPHRSHVGEEAEVAERRALGGEADFVPRERPAFARNFAGKLPAAAAVLIGTGDEFAVGIPVIEAWAP